MKKKRHLLMYNARMKKMITYRQLAEMLGKSRTSICNYEILKIVPPLETAQKICEILEIDLDDFYSVYSRSDMEELEE